MFYEVEKQFLLTYNKLIKGSWKGQKYRVASRVVLTHNRGASYRQSKSFFFFPRKLRWSGKYSSIVNQRY